LIPSGGAGSQTLVLRGLAGNDTFNLDFSPFSLVFVSVIQVEGGDSDATSDVLNHIANGDAATTIDLETGTITSTAVSTVTFTGVEEINHTSAGTDSTLDVLGTSGPDVF